MGAWRHVLTSAQSPSDLLILLYWSSPITEPKTNSPTAKMSDDESCFSAEERKMTKTMFKTKRERVRTKESDELDETLKVYIDEWRDRRQKELDELSKLKEKQAKRRVLRAEEEKKLIEQKKIEEDKKKKLEKAARAKTKKTEVKKSQVVRGGIDSGKTKRRVLRAEEEKKLIE